LLSDGAIILAIGPPPGNQRLRHSVSGSLLSAVALALLMLQ
jgi:hypothetical protein